jgi:hypothetical protein
MNWTLEVARAGFAAWATISTVVWAVDLVKIMLRRAQGDD